MIKLIKQYGNSLVVVFSVEEAKAYGLKLGDKVIVQKEDKGGKNDRHK